MRSLLCLALLLAPAPALAVGNEPFQTPWEFGIVCDGIDIYADVVCCGGPTGAICVPADTKEDLLLEFMMKCNDVGGTLWVQPMHYCQWGVEPYPLPPPDCPQENC